MTAPDRPGFFTRAIHAGQTPDPATGALVTPIYANSTYAQSSPGVHQGFDYSRSENPTRMAFERAIADLEGGRQGYAFASGMAAISTMLELLNAGDHVVASNDLYGGTVRLFESVRRFSAGLDVTYVDMADLQALEEAIRPETRLIWLETPTNPLLEIYDLAAIAALAKKNGLIAAADNTFASPYVQRPIEHGFDIVMHSTTKYIGGHSDIIGGALVAGARPDLAEKLQFLHNAVGAIAGPFDSFLAHRGLKTLGLRMRQHCENALKLARFLEGHPAMKRVIYPGLESHPQHAIAKCQMNGFGAIITAELDRDAEGVKRFQERCKVITLAESLGGIESLIEQPCFMTHASMTAAQRARAGISDSMVRLSVGLEDAEDLIADLEQALTA
jgi:cystathionine gamma-lyase